MTIPLALFLYIFYAFLLVWFVFCSVAVYHMINYGFKTFATFLATAIFVVFSVITLMVVFYYIGKIDWQMNVTIMDGIFLNNLDY